MVANNDYFVFPCFKLNILSILLHFLIVVVVFLLHEFYRATFIFILALVGVFYPYNRGALFTALVVIYALTSGIAGYTAASFYCQLEGANWVSLFFLLFKTEFHEYTFWRCFVKDAFLY